MLQPKQALRKKSEGGARDPLNTQSKLDTPPPLDLSDSSLLSNLIPTTPAINPNHFVETPVPHPFPIVFTPEPAPETPSLHPNPFLFIPNTHTPPPPAPIPFPVVTPEGAVQYFARPVAAQPTQIQPEPELRILREQDRFLPVANIFRIMKDSMPPGAKCAKEAKECMQECASEFLSFITSEYVNFGSKFRELIFGRAHDRCVADGRKIIAAGDILTSLAALGFDNYVPLLENYYDTLIRARTKEDEAKEG